MVDSERYSPRGTRSLPCCRCLILSGQWTRFLFNKLRRFRFCFHLQQNWVQLDPSLQIWLFRRVRHFLLLFNKRFCFHYFTEHITIRSPVYSYHGMPCAQPATVCRYQLATDPRNTRAVSCCRVRGLLLRTPPPYGRYPRTVYLRLFSRLYRPNT